LAETLRTAEQGSLLSNYPYPALPRRRRIPRIPQKVLKSKKKDAKKDGNEESREGVNY